MDHVFLLFNMAGSILCLETTVCGSDQWGRRRVRSALRRVESFQGRARRQTSHHSRDSPEVTLHSDRSVRTRVPLHFLGFSNLSSPCKSSSFS